MTNADLQYPIGARVGARQVSIMPGARARLAKALEQVIDARRAAEIGLFDALADPSPLSPGADSRLIWILETFPSTVLKLGRRDIVELEVGFLTQAKDAGLSAFPRMEAHGRLGDDAWYLMEAGIPGSGESEF